MRQRNPVTNQARSRSWAPTGETGTEPFGSGDAGEESLPRGKIERHKKERSTGYLPGRAMLKTAIRIEWILRPRSKGTFRSDVVSNP